MLTNKEHQAMIIFDRLLMMADENDTVKDLLDQTLNVARMINPDPNDNIVYGPLQRMHFDYMQMKNQLQSLSNQMQNYITNQNRYSGSTFSEQSSWPSNPGLDTMAGMNIIGTPTSYNTIQGLMPKDAK